MGTAFQKEGLSGGKGTQPVGRAIKQSGAGARGVGCGGGTRLVRQAERGHTRCGG